MRARILSFDSSLADQVVKERPQHGHLEVNRTSRNATSNLSFTRAFFATSDLIVVNVQPADCFNILFLAKEAFEMAEHFFIAFESTRFGRRVRMYVRPKNSTASGIRVNSSST